jgi:hypothetical protein
MPTRNTESDNASNPGDQYRDLIIIHSTLLFTPRLMSLTPSK